MLNDHAPLQPLSFAEILELESDAPLFLMDGEMSLVSGGVNMLVGDGGVGKSFLAQQLAVALAAGESVLGSRTMGPKSVLYLDFENPPGFIQSRLQGFNSYYNLVESGVSLPLKYWFLAELGQTLPQLQDQIMVQLDLQVPELVVVDSLASAFRTDAVEGVDALEALAMLQRLASKGAAVLVLHHQTKGSVNAGNKEAAGHRQLTNQAKAVYHLAMKKSGLTIELTKSNYIERTGEKPLSAVTEGGARVLELGPSQSFRVPLDHDHSPTMSLPQTGKDMVLSFIRSEGGSVTESDLWRALGKRIHKAPKTAKRVHGDDVTALVRGGVLKRAREGRTYRLTVPSSASS
ncbi:MAG: AAA family ATPase [Vulcanimicrobiota bacterium]